MPKIEALSFYPILDFEDDEWQKEYDKGEQLSYYSYTKRQEAKNEGYAKAKQDLFTQEDVFETINLYLKWLTENKHSNRTGKDVIVEIMNQIKQPKVEITFENGKPIKCVML